MSVRGFREIRGAEEEVPLRKARTQESELRLRAGSCFHAFLSDLSRSKATVTGRRSTITLALRALLIAALLLSGCGQRADVVICEHCYCVPFGSRDLAHPISCTTLGRDLVCCIADSS